MVAVHGVDLQGPDDPVDLDIVAVVAALHRGKKIVQSHFLLLDVLPDAAALLPVARPDRQPPLEPGPGFVEQGQKSAVELQALPRR